MKIKKEIMREHEVNTERGGACSTSYPSGNQVDGLPLVAILNLGEIAGTSDGGNLVHWTSELKFN